MPTNVLLVRWKDGWHEVVDAASVAVHPRHEAFLALGALQSIPEVDRVAGMQLSVIAHPRTAVAADHDPMGVADRPYRSYNVGDIITVPNFGTGTSGQRVRAITGSEDENGEVTYSPELGDLLLEEQERMMQAVKKMSDGTLEGESPVAQPTRVYVPAIMARPVPKVKGGSGMLTVRTTRPFHTDYSSAPLTEVGGTTSVAPSSFQATVTAIDPNNTMNPSIDVWQDVPGGDGSFVFGSIPFGAIAEVGDTVYGLFFPSGAVADVQFGPDHGIHFQSNQADFSADVELVFNTTGGTYTVEWAGS